MREILFRGKRLYMCDWVEGTGIFNDGTNTWISYNEPNKPINFGMKHQTVYAETVGQFTGLTDKNGKKIFEGDIFHLDDEVVAVVIFQNGSFRLEEYGLTGTFTESGFDECGGGWDVIDCSPIDWYTINNMEIIGNIHDNPELLEGA